MWLNSIEFRRFSFCCVSCLFDWGRLFWSCCNGARSGSLLNCLHWSHVEEQAAIFDKVTMWSDCCWLVVWFNTQWVTDSFNERYDIACSHLFCFYSSSGHDMSSDWKKRSRKRCLLKLKFYAYTQTINDMKEWVSM